jgi:hypothetical protein
LIPSYHPQDNIVFEDSREAVLYQNRREVFRCKMMDTDNVLKLLNLFFSYERAEIAQFRKADGSSHPTFIYVVICLAQRISRTALARYDRSGERCRLLGYTTYRPPTGVV